MSSTNSTNIDRCQFNGGLMLSQQQNNNVTDSIFGCPVATLSCLQGKYSEGECFRREDHRMFKALQISCPCTQKIPLQVSGNDGREIRIYDHDIVFMNSKGQFESSLADAIALVREQQKMIEQLQERIEALEKKSRKK